MARSFIPYGLLANGNYGINIDPATQYPLASAVEILSTLPSLASTDNYDGRMVFNLTDSVVYTYTNSPVAQWTPLGGLPATVGNVAGAPPTIPTPASGEMYWDLDTQVLFTWDGAVWQAAGGRYAAQVVENSYVGDGVTASYPSGSSVAISAEYVEIYLDGVRQTATSDYNIVGTLVSFVTPPPIGVMIYTRSLISTAIAQTAQVARAQYTAIGGDTTFTTGLAGSDPAGVFVYLDGQLKAETTDYALVQQDTSIVSLVKTGPTVGLVTTNAAHSIPLGASVRFTGFTEPEFNNTNYTIVTTPSVTSFTITLNILDAASGTPNPTASFSPPYVNDTIVFVAPLGGGELVDIRSLRNVVVSANNGEINTLASTGAGVSLVAPKVGVALQTKSLTAGANVSVNDLGSSVEITATTGQGFEDRAGINAASYTVGGTTSYVGVRNTSIPVTIDLTGILAGVSNSGRKITIKDESGGAAGNAITVTAGVLNIDGVGTPYSINTNYGSVTMVFDGNDWYIIAARP